MKKINEVYVFVAEQIENGILMEGVVGRELNVLGKDVFMPFVCADKERVDQLRPLAKELSKLTNKKIKLIKLSVREELEII